MVLSIPRALEADHEEFLDAVRLALRVWRETAPVVRRVLDLLEAHLDCEAETVGPLLSLLHDLPGGAGPAATADLLLEAFHQAHPRLVEQHRTLAALGQELHEVAVQQDRPDMVCLAQRLVNHARLYDTLLFPAALLAGQAVGRRADAAARPAA